MCGIMGYVGADEAWPIVMAGLRRLEYRGYDSAGIATVHRRRLKLARRVGPLSNLERAFAEGLPGSIGLGHTRWATHGEVSERNCHPHLDLQDRVAVVHNGIIDNVAELRAALGEPSFRSDTDTEVIAYRIAAELQGDTSLLEAVRRALVGIRGTAGLLVMAREHPDLLVAARIGSPIVVGLGDGAGYVASDASALVGAARQVVHLQEGEIALIGPGTLRVVDREARPRAAAPEPLGPEVSAYERGDHEHFFERELLDQPAAVSRATAGRLDPSLGTARLGGLEELQERLFAIRRLVMFGCGSSLHAAEIGRYLVESLARLPAAAEQAAELRDRNAVVEPDTLYLALSQSGETADALAAVRELKVRGAVVAGVTNQVGSSIARETRCGVYLHAGPEVSVASTKSFVCHVAVLALIALRFARMRGLSAADGRTLVEGLAELPRGIESMLDQRDRVAEIAARFADAPYAMFVGRGISWPVAREGALKLKELAYTPCDGLSGAEAKHGPLAMITGGTPVWAIVPPDHTRDRMIGNLEELRARGAVILAVADPGDRDVRRLAHEVLEMPRHPSALSPCLSVVPLQLYAYHVARARGREVDRPRNLAKSVTVE